MIGLKVTRRSDGAEFTVTGFDGRVYSLTPSVFGAVEAAGLAELVDAFDASAADLTPPPTEAQIIAQRDADANRTINTEYGNAVAGAAARKKREPEPDPSSPEGVFAALGRDGGQ